MDKENLSILTKYILVGTFNDEWLVQLYPCPSYRSVVAFLEFREPSVVAVYKPTGRVFSEKNKRSWEYYYEGVRVL